MGMLLFIHLEEHQAPFAIDHEINARSASVALATKADGLLVLETDARALEEVGDSLLFLLLALDASLGVKALFMACQTGKL